MNEIIRSGLPNVLQRSSASLVHHRNRRTMFICCVIVLMSAVSAIGLKLCPMATGENCSNYSTTTTAAAFQTFLNDKKDFQVNVYVSAIINHNNITINSDKGINIDTMSVDNFTTTSTDLDSNGVWQKLFPKQFQFVRSSINGIEERPPKTEFLKSNSTTMEVNNLAQHDESYFDPCSHPEYIVFTWVSID